MLYFLDFSVQYPSNMSQQELFNIWHEEADAALSAKHAGVVIDLWKVVGERKVLCIVDVENPDQLDQILMDLPIMKKHGQHVDVKVSALRRYEDFAEDVKGRIN